MEHGLKDIAFYGQKHITPCTIVITSRLVRGKPIEAPVSVKQVYWSESKMIFVNYSGGWVFTLGRGTGHYEIWTFKLNLTLTVKFNQHSSSRDLNQSVLHLLSKFVSFSLNGWWVIMRTSWGLTCTHTHGYTHRSRRKQWQYPKAKSGFG